jgi:hypothetical protein
MADTSRIAVAVSANQTEVFFRFLVLAGRK